MVTVNIVVTDDAVQPEIYLGRQGEKQAREIVFDLSALRTKYGTGTATLYHQRSKDPAPYLIAETTGTTMTWTVSETDTVYAGIGYCEFRYTFGTEGLSKSTMFATNVKASLSGDVIIPAALQAWYDALIEYIDAGMDGQGITNDIKDALLQIASKVVYVDGDGQTYYNALYDALYPAVKYSVTNTLTGCTTSNDATKAVSGSSYSATITANTGYSLTGATVSVTMGGIDITSTAYNNGMISIASVSGDIVITVTAVAITLTGIDAAYTQSGTVYDTDTLDSLKTDLVVTAVYSDGSTQTVPAADYTLSGTLVVGTSTITVTYGGKTTAFSVVVTQAEWGSDYTWLYKASDGQLLSARTDLVTASIGTGCTETLENDSLRLFVPQKTSNLIRFNLAQQTNTKGKLTARVKFHSVGYANAGTGLRLQISNGTNGTQIFEHWNGPSAYNFGVYEGSTYSDKLAFELNAWHIISVERTDTGQVVSVDGTPILESSNMSTNYCSNNAILAQNSPSTSPADDLDVDIAWITYKNND